MKQLLSRHIPLCVSPSPQRSGWVIHTAALLRHTVHRQSRPARGPEQALQDTRLIPSISFHGDGAEIKV